MSGVLLYWLNEGDENAVLSLPPVSKSGVPVRLVFFSKPIITG